MKRIASILLILCLLITSITLGTPTVDAAQKATFSRHIGIVFDNSGSMYLDKKTDWCRATYAMEVFASMLNKGDVLTIYPMHPIEVAGKQYTMEKPFQITDSSQSAKIREIYTPDAKGTPIKTIDFAADGIAKAKADKKYLIVLTDGDSFDGESGEKTIKNLDAKLKPLASPEMMVMYLGVGKNAVVPSLKNSDYFVKKHAKNSADVLSYLTDMCNKIFGRDTLPKNHIKGKNIDFDISMSKVIVFVQGTNIANLKVTGASGEMGTKAGTATTKYSTKGCGKTSRGNTKATPDKNLQGMMVTYTDCAAGQYNIKFSGKATNIEVYYEPDADLNFIFTDSEGNDVDPKELYEGDYKVAFGMKDAKTNQLIESDLLGNPHYEGSCFINGQEIPFSHDGLSGEVDISLKKDDMFDAKLTASYLNGYVISKDSTDFGWPEGGLKVVPMPAGKLKLEITGGERSYPLQSLEKGEPFIAKVYHEGKQLTGAELEKVKLSWDPNTSYAEIKQTFADDHFKLSLHYKNPESPKDTVCGRCKVTIQANYTAQGSDEATAKRTLTYSIDEDDSKVKMQVSVPQDYIVIKDLDSSEAITVKFPLNGEPMTPEQFKRLKLNVACDKIEHTVTPNENDASYTIKLKATKGIGEGDYTIGITANYTDAVGRTTDLSENVEITLSNTPLWLKWLIAILLLLLLFIIIWMILHIRVLPKKIKPINPSMIFYGEDVTHGTQFKINASKGSRVGTMTVTSEYGGTKASISMTIKPGKESYLYKSQKRRSIEVERNSVKKVGITTVEKADVGSGAYKYDEQKDNLIPSIEAKNNFIIRNGNEIRFSGLMPDDATGKDKDFATSVRLNFAKK